MKTALVTGSLGFLGRALVPRLIETGCQVTAIDPVKDTITFQEWLGMFYRDLEPQFDIVVHLAATLTQFNIADRNGLGISAFDDIRLDYAMAHYLERCPPRQRAIWMSSCAVDAQEYENYAFVKYVGERFAMNLAKQNVPITILRPYGGYGPGQSLNYPFPSILQRAMRKEDPLTVWGSLDTARDWIYVDDIVTCILSSIEETIAPMLTIPLSVGTGRCVTFGNLARMMADAVGYNPKIVALADKPVGSKHRVCPFVSPYRVSLEDGIQRCLEAARAADLLKG